MRACSGEQEPNSANMVLTVTGETGRAGGVELVQKLGKPCFRCGQLCGRQKIRLEGGLVGKERKGSGDLRKGRERNEIFRVVGVGEFVVEAGSRIHEKQAEMRGSGGGVDSGAGRVSGSKKNSASSEGRDGASREVGCQLEG